MLCVGYALLQLWLCCSCAEGVGAELAAGARLDNKSEGLVGLKAHVVVAIWALDVAGYFASASSPSSYAR